jgi:hypothetical protein
LAGGVAASVRWLTWLEETALARAMRESEWLYPAVEVAHIIGIATLVGAAAMFDLRILGLSRRLPVADLARHLLPWAHRGLALQVASGLLLFLADPAELAGNPAFRAKLVLIVLAGCNAAAFHLGVFRSVSAWDRDAEPPRPAKAAALLSLALWTGVVSAGRLIAYV